MQEGAWLPAGAWAACPGEADIEDGEVVFVGCDIGGSRAASAVVICTEDLRVQARVWQGDDAVLMVAAHVEEIARRYAVRECCYDPWRFRSEALRLEQAGLRMVEFPQTNVRMVPASEQLYSAIVEQRHAAGAGVQDPRVVVMPLRPCLVCGELAQGSWCERHRPVWKNRSPSSRATARPGWNQLRARALRRDGWRCVYCGAGDDGLEVHHVLPVSEGGKNTLSNIVTISHACHVGAHREPPPRVA